MTLAGRLRLKLQSVRAELLPNGSATPLTRAVASVAGELRHAAVNVTGRSRLMRAAARGDGALLQVHLGCGGDVRAGWLNVDLEPTRAAREHAARNGAQLIRYDLRRGLPLPVASCTLIYSSHFLEHVEFRQGLRLMRDCHRALAPRGRFRAALPNFRGAFGAYLAGDSDYFATIDHTVTVPYSEPDMESLVDFINYSVYQHGEHRFIYDQDKIVRTLRAVGFSSVSIVDYDAELDPPSELRRRYSFYVEGVR